MSYLSGLKLCIGLPLLIVSLCLIYVIILMPEIWFVSVFIILLDVFGIYVYVGLKSVYLSMFDRKYFDVIKGYEKKECTVVSPFYMIVDNSCFKYFLSPVVYIYDNAMIVRLDDKAFLIDDLLSNVEQGRFFIYPVYCFKYKNRNIKIYRNVFPQKIKDLFSKTRSR